MGKHWLDGIYLSSTTTSVAVRVRGEQVTWSNIAEFDFPDYVNEEAVKGIWKHGKYQEATKEIIEATGETFYNVEMNYMDGKMVMHGTISEDGKTIYCMDFTGSGMDTMIWTDAETLKKVLDGREHIDHQSTLYKIQPQNQGKLLWLSGPPGAGKSTSGLLLAKHHDYVYYEADCFMNFLNPYIPLDVAEPSLAQVHQKPMKGRSLDAVKSLQGCMTEFTNMAEGKEFNPEKLAPFYHEMCKDILAEKKRIGGRWAVAQAVPTRQLRDQIRKDLGSQCIFITLSLSAETNRKRVEARHSEGDETFKKMIIEMLNNMFKMYEPAQEGEENAINVVIGPDMSKDDVVKEILKKVQDF